MITIPTIACVFDLLYVLITLFANDTSGVVPREVYLPLYVNSSDYLYRLRAGPMIPGTFYLDKF